MLTVGDVVVDFDAIAQALGSPTPPTTTARRSDT